MVFLGDIAIPFRKAPSVPYIPWKDGEFIVGNLEGDIADVGGRTSDNHVVFNAPSVVDYLDRLGVDAVSLANNHILDCHRSPERTQEILAEIGIATFGAGRTRGDAERPVGVREEKETSVQILGFGWDGIGCRTATTYRSGVNPLEPSHVVESVKEVRREKPAASIVVYIHWNYELELYPQPLHRQLAFRAIDAGAQAIVGTHSHRVQGIEVYNGSPIVHGLGNWMFAQGEYYGGSLTFPECAALELAFEWNPETSEMTCHWFKYDSHTHELSYIESEPMDVSDRIEELTPFQGMDHNEYTTFFKDNRLKWKLLPIYYSCDQEAANVIKNKWLKVRGRILELCYQLGIKSVERKN